MYIYFISSGKIRNLKIEVCLALEYHLFKCCFLLVLFCIIYQWRVINENYRHMLVASFH